MANPIIWIPLPIGPLRTLESVSVRANSGEWTDIPLERFILDTNRLGVKGGWPEIAFGIHSVRIVGQGGFTPLTSLIEGVWMNVVRCLYDSDLPDMTLVHDMIKPLKSLMFRALI